LKNYFISSAKVLQKSEKQKDFSKKTLFILSLQKINSKKALRKWKKT